MSKLNKWRSEMRGSIVALALIAMVGCTASEPERSYVTRRQDPSQWPKDYDPLPTMTRGPPQRQLLPAPPAAQAPVDVTGEWECRRPNDPVVNEYVSVTPDDGSCWPVHDQGQLRAELYGFFEHALYAGPNGEPTPFDPSRRKVDDLVDALKSLAHIPVDTPTPAWLQKASNAGRGDCRLLQ